MFNAFFNFFPEALTNNLPPNLKRQKGVDKARKDSYSALVLGNWMMNVFYDMNSEDIGNIQSTFTPMFIS